MNKKNNSFKFKKNFSFIVLLFLFFCISIPLVHAQNSLMGGVSTQCQSDGTCQINDFVRILTTYGRLILGISGSFALLFFVIGGLMFLISGGNQDRVSRGKNMITGSIIGLILVLSAYSVIGFILKTLNVSGAENWFNTNSLF